MLNFSYYAKLPGLEISEQISNVGTLFARLIGRESVSHEDESYITKRIFFARFMLELPTMNE